MKIVTYSTGGQASYGVVAGDGVVDAKKRMGAAFPTVKSVLAAGALGQVAAAVKGAAADHKLADIAFLPPVPDPDKIICIGLNYRSHVLEGGRDLPQHPMIFTRFANAQVGHGQPMIRSKVSDKFDFEGEMALVIGKACRHVPESQALSVIAGYSCYNDGTHRDWQRHTSQFTPGKNFKDSGAFGPWLVTADEIPDPSRLTLLTRLNGEEMQRATTDDLLFNVPQLIAYCSGFTELVPGDVIVTGTTGGVGVYRTPPVFMKPGDTIEVDISSIGVLRNTIADEA
ncbi:MAG: fumarylacetoacetate hydrolase family protein [Rhodospirillales bacterium]